VSDNGIRRQIFDAQTALKNGFSEDTVLLAQEMIDCSNEMLKAATAGAKSITNSPLDVEKYPKLAVFFNLASQQQTNKSTNTIEPCGDWEHPVPNSRPPATYYTAGDSEQALIGKEFHHTAGYACGEYDASPNCTEYDFTRGRGISGPYGDCAAPRFRDHGVIERRRYSIHGAEPNPEIASYLWPYWNWGPYVKWWHSKF